MLAYFEKRFAIFGLIFLSDVIGVYSLFVDPDPAADSGGAYNPLYPVLSLIQYSVYGITFFLLVARPHGSVRTVLRDPLVWCLTLLAPLSFLWSDVGTDSLRKGVTLFQTSTFGLYLATRFTPREQIRLLTWALGLIALFSLLFTLAKPGSAIEAGANAGSWRGPFVQKNIFARVEVLSAAVFLVEIMLAQHPSRWIWGGFWLSLLLVFLTGSKTALLVFIALLILVPLYRALRWNTTIVIPIIITVLLIMGSLTTVVVGNWEGLLLGLGKDPTLSGRTHLWEIALEKIANRPWLGYGYMGFWQSRGEAFDIWKAVGYRPPHAHNGYINMALDFGYVGFGLFAMSIIVNFRRGIEWVRSGTTATEIWPILYVTFFFLYNYSESTIVQHNSLFWALYVAAGLTMRRVSRHRMAEAPPPPVVRRSPVSQESQFNPEA
ncbi:O-antigen ligase [Geitlerinema sp. PCC 7407]|uniref:O-antigen ligase family protein n=1 Tax=Geitlerinema sp. PCC 7407 TaxID=1173025 RepID=UPI00029FD7D5|nr:O-antigen ligase [Geitlerinema sp. PCC 7407]AFY66519.1 O-antigen polymerase [Geitlerinema sp. PCC 7407]